MVCSSGRRPTDRRGCCRIPNPRPTPDEAAYLLTSERFRLLKRDPLARPVDVRPRDETEQDGRSQ
jgi:hypothetical protein